MLWFRVRMLFDADAFASRSEKSVVRLEKWSQEFSKRKMLETIHSKYIYSIFFHLTKLSGFIFLQWHRARLFIYSGLWRLCTRMEPLWAWSNPPSLFCLRAPSASRSTGPSWPSIMERSVRFYCRFTLQGFFIDQQIKNIKMSQKWWTCLSFPKP